MYLGNLRQTNVELQLAIDISEVRANDHYINNKTISNNRNVLKVMFFVILFLIAQAMSNWRIFIKYTMGRVELKIINEKIHCLYIYDQTTHGEETIGIFYIFIILYRR